MRVLVFGYGSMGKRHAANAKALDGDVLVCDPDRDLDIPFARTHIEHGWDAIGHDVAVIASPVLTHARYAGMVGTPALIEKPLARNVAEWERYGAHAIAERMWVGYNLRFHPGIQVLRRTIKDSWRGHISASFLLQCDKSKWPGKFYADMLLEGSHEIDLALWLLGPATVVSASGSGDRWSLTLSHASGDISTLILNGTCRTHARGIHFSTGTESLTWEWEQNGQWETSCRYRGGGSVAKGLTTAEVTYERELGEFFKHAFSNDPAPTLCTVREGLDVLRVCDTAREMTEGTCRTWQ